VFNFNHANSKSLPTMRLNAVLATALYSSAALVGQVRGDDIDEAVGGDVSSSAVESATSTVPAEKPTFTVRSFLLLWHCKSEFGEYFAEMQLTLSSLQISKHHSSNSLPMAGTLDGNHLMLRKR
jgi:hypothetical protein